MAKGFMVKSKEYVPVPTYPDGALYWEGEEVPVMTGGWENGSWHLYKYSQTFVAPIKNADNVYLEVPAITYRTSGIITINQINLTAFTTLRVEYTSLDLPEALQVHVITTKNSSSTQLGTAETTNNGTKQILTLNVSSVNQSGFVCVEARSGGVVNSGNATIHRVWLEV